MVSSLLVLGSSLFCWALLLVVSRVLLITFGFEPWPFTFVQMIAGGLVLVTLARDATVLGGALRDPFTWLYGILRVATATFFTAALVHTSTANAAFLGLVSVPIGMAAVWTVLRRRPSRWELPGHLTILIGLGLLAQSLDGGWRNPALVLMILSEVCVVASTLIAELHRLNRTEDVRQRAGLTGIMLLASSVLMLAAALLLSLLARGVPALGEAGPLRLAGLDDPARVMDPMLWLAACLIGILLRGPALYLSLKAIAQVGTENYVAGLAALPFLSYALEAVAVALGLLEPTPLPVQALLVGTVMTLGSLTVLWARSQRLRTPPGNERRPGTT